MMNSIRVRVGPFLVFFFSSDLSHFFCRVQLKGISSFISLFSLKETKKNFC